MVSGNINFVFHSHLPWVMNHGNWPHGEDWLFEAVIETYIPILNITEELVRDGISPKFTIGFSPVLCEQLAHKDFFRKFEKYCNYKIEYARRDELKFINENQDGSKVYLSKFWLQFYTEGINFLKSINGNILTKFKDLQDDGHIEIITCGATHAYLPLVGSDRTVEAQIDLAVQNYQKHFGRKPNGIWLPECAYRPSYSWETLLNEKPESHNTHRYGIEELLEKYDIKYFISDQKNLENSLNVGDEEGNHYTELTPYKIYNVSSKYPKEGGKAKVFTRHLELSMQVWSGDKGYPSNPDYLDFHKKEGGSMLRYWRVTDSKLDMQFKDLYRPEWTWDKTELQAHHYIKLLEESSYFANDKYQIKSTICLPFDTELFGHWWFEGPEFLKRIFRGIHASPYINLTTCTEQLEFASGENINLVESSWGKNNNHSVWINDRNKWCWEVLYNAENQIIGLVDNHESSNELSDRILNQLVRSLQVLYSSDWEFLIDTDTATDYSEMRITNHFSDIKRMIEYYYNSKTRELSENEIQDLMSIEQRDDIFDNLHYSIYANK
jgi:1,4-alpha-glucan branching enzyme